MEAKRQFKLDFGHMYKVSEGGYIHFVFLALNFGSDGLAIVVLNFFTVIGYVKKQK